MQWKPKKTPAKPTPRPQARAPLPRQAPPPPEVEEPKPQPRKRAKLSRLHKPAGMSLEDWQIELRRQFGREQQFLLKNVGAERIFSEFEVTNPQSKSSYRVHVRGPNLGDNYCSCP